MKLTLLLLALLVLNAYGQHFLKRQYGLPPIGEPQTRARAPVLNLISQRVDHFNVRDTRTWQMRYYSNDQFYTEGGPIFIYIGGEWAITPAYVMTGLMFDMAAEHNGYMFYTEHRYYGYSYPTEDRSEENLQYLSIDQALADLAYFIEEKKRTISGAANSKVVVVGGSYSATMATWFRMKYPHLVDAAWSSSAPLRATTDFFEYYQHVGEEIRRVDSTCYDNIREAMDELVDNLQTPEGVENMSTTFNTCNLIDTTEPEISYFFVNIADPLINALHNASNSSTIQSACNFFNSFGTNNFERLVGYMNYFNGGRCIRDLKEFIDYYSATEISLDYGRLWLYQCCSEFGWYQTGTGEQPFAYFSNEFFLETCNQLYSLDRDMLSTAVDRTNIFYGSINPEVTRVVFTHGTIDPWMSMGVQSDINDQAPVILIPEAAHCADLGSISIWDSVEMVAAKQRIMSLIAEWIS